MKSKFLQFVIKGSITSAIVLSLTFSGVESNTDIFHFNNNITAYAAETPEYDESRGLIYYGGMVYEVFTSKKEIYLLNYAEEKSDTLNLPKSIKCGKVTYKLTGIHPDALFGSSYKKIVVPDSVTYIGEGAFYNCELLKKITLPKGLKAIEAQTFYNCAALTDLTIPESLTSIGEEAFFGCLSLVSIVIPDTVKVIGADAFSECKKLKEVTLSKNITTLSDGTFSYCGTLSKVIMPEKLKYIEDNVFEECKSLKELKLPSSLLEIGYNAFSGCAFKSIKFPKKLKECGYDAFSDCSKLTTVYVPESLLKYYKELFEYESFKIVKY